MYFLILYMTVHHPLCMYIQTDLVYHTHLFHTNFQIKWGNWISEAFIHSAGGSVTNKLQYRVRKLDIWGAANWGTSDCIITILFFLFKGQQYIEYIAQLWATLKVRTYVRRPARFFLFLISGCLAVVLHTYVYNILLSLMHVHMYVFFVYDIHMIYVRTYLFI